MAESTPKYTSEKGKDFDRKDVGVNMVGVGRMCRERDCPGLHCFACYS